MGGPLSLVVVSDSDIVRVPRLLVPDKNNEPLLVDGDHVVPLVGATQLMKAVPWGLEILEGTGVVENVESPPRLAVNALKGLDPFPSEKPLSALVGSRANHDLYALRIR